MESEDKTAVENIQEEYIIKYEVPKLCKVSTVDTLLLKMKNCTLALVVISKCYFYVDELPITKEDELSNSNVLLASEARMQRELHEGKTLIIKY